MTASAEPVNKSVSPAGDVDRQLLSRSFLGLLFTQFLGATNDNILRWLVIGIGKQYVTDENIRLVLSAGTACFVLPYLLLAAPAGYLADKFSKRKVIVACKLAEIAIMTAAIVAILIGNLYLLFAVVAIMGAQSALFGPSKLGSIPEMLHASKISAANGLVGLTTVIATVVGAVLGNTLTDVTRSLDGSQYPGQHQWWLSAVVLIGVAAAGWLASLMIRRLPAASPGRTFPWDAAKQTIRDLQVLGRSKPMLRVALGIMFFWSLGALAQLNIDQYATEGGATEQKQVAPLLTALVVGVGFGSVLAGIWSGGRVELGILPLGAGGLALSAFLLYMVEGTLVDPAHSYTANYALACGFLVMLGISAGLFDVPLAAYMQHHSPVESRGSILAASNFLTFSGMLLISAVYWLLGRHDSAGNPLLTSREIFLLCGLLTVPVFIYIVWLIPQASIRFVVWLATHTVYRVRLHGRENLPEEGGALMCANHVTWADGVLLLVTSSRPVRILIFADYLKGWWARWIARTMGALPIKSTPKAMTAAIETARQAIANGELVCIFPEGSITQTGQLQAFKPGLMKIIQNTDAPVIPVYLDELWGSIFSYRSGKFLLQRPQQWPYPVSIWFGRPVNEPNHVGQVRQAVQDLGAEAVQNRTTRSTLLPKRFVRQCKRKLTTSKIADSSGADLKGGAVLMRTLILRRLLNREVLSADEQHVGVLLPPSAGGVLVNAALALDGRVSANLNYTASNETLNQCIAQAGIRHILTSRKVLEKLDLSLDAELICLEDFKDKVTLGDKLCGLLLAYVCPAPVIDWVLKLNRADGDDVLTVIFTSGSTGVPKGVMLTHKNVLSNVEAIDQLVHLREEDVIIGILPFFHSFGYTVTLWTVLGKNIKGAYHFTPLDPKQVGKLVQKHGGTVILATPTFLRSYLRRCEKEEFQTLDVAVVGAEKMPLELAEAFEKKFGIRPVEGYGTTELSPLVSVNVPPSRSLSATVDLKEGTVGRPVPGVSAKICDPENFSDLPQGSEGMLLIKGPNVMAGYLNQPDKTTEVIRDGWYVTGDIAVIDGDGFIRITGRQSRFSKIGGEMVPHLLIEEALQRLVGNDEELALAVTSIPDEKKGERLIVLMTDAVEQDPDTLRKGLADAGYSNLWIPARDCFIRVDEIPVLGTGKLDLRGLNQLAMDLCGT